MILPDSAWGKDQSGVDDLVPVMGATIELFLPNQHDWKERPSKHDVVLSERAEDRDTILIVKEKAAHFWDCLFG